MLVLTGMNTTVPLSVSIEPDHALTMAARICGYLKLPDLRLVKRALQLWVAWLVNPGASLAAATGNRAAAKAAYAFIAHPDVSVEALQEAIYTEGGTHCAGHERVCIVQDTTSLEYGHRAPIEGLGYAAAHETQGLLIHTSMAVSVEGQPLSLVDQQIWTRPRPGYSPASTRALEERESIKWQEGMRRSVARLPAGCHPIFIMDREGDIHEVFAEARERNHGVVVRLRTDRRIQGEPTGLIQAVQEAPEADRYVLRVPRKPGGTPDRDAMMVVRYTRVVLSPNCHKAPHRGPVELNVVLASEEDGPGGVEPVEWYLVTTEPVESVEEARQIVNLYTKRWRVEEFHLVLKSGCRVEAHQFKSKDTLEKAVVLQSPVAMTLLALTYLGRTRPEALASEVLDGVQIEVIRRWCGATKNRLPAGPLSISDAVRLIGRMGGHLGRKCDGPVGVRSLWKGWSKLEAMALMVRDPPQ